MTIGLAIAGLFSNAWVNGAYCAPDVGQPAGSWLGLI
jgi:hypothetical protein